MAFLTKPPILSRRAYAARSGEPARQHATYLSWHADQIHGTHDTHKTGRDTSSGCVGLYNEHVAGLFAMAAVGTQVKLF